MTRSTTQLTARRVNNQLTKIGMIALATIWTSLAMLFAFTDLAISQSFANSESGLGVFVEYYGEIPGLAAIVFTLFVVHANHSRRRIALEIPLWIFMIALTSLVGYYASAVFYSRLVGNFDWFAAHGQWYWLALAVFQLALHVAIRNHRFNREIHRYAQITVGVAVFNVLIFVQIFKPLWGRVRFRDLDPGFTNFFPWYLPQGVADASSFPSGHAALGWMLLPLVVLAGRQNPAVRRSVAAGIVLWGIFVSTGRVLVGAHYASDVLFSTGVAFAAVAFWTSRIQPGRDSKEPDPNTVAGTESSQENTD